MSTCRPEEHIIPLDEGYQIHVVIDEEWGHQRYIPEYLEDTWKSLLPDGVSRLTIVEARNDCAMHAGREVIS